jgi:hypothetical protein
MGETMALIMNIPGYEAKSGKMASYGKPVHAVSPTDHLDEVVQVLFDGGEEKLSVAIVNRVCSNGTSQWGTVAIRWNGSASDPEGWQLLPEELASTIQFLAEQHFQFKLPFYKANAVRFMALFGKLFSTESLAKELKSRGYKLMLEA